MSAWFLDSELSIIRIYVDENPGENIPRGLTTLIFKSIALLSPLLSYRQT